MSDRTPSRDRSSKPAPAGFSRRDFVKAAAAGAAALAFPTIVPSSALGDEKTAPAAQRLTVGVIGLGKQGAGHHLMGKLIRPDMQILAVCDVYELRREHFKKAVDDKYADMGRKEYKGCAAYTDYRELLARKDIDAVVIATPDHWHTAQVIDACKAKKDIYCEKPLTLTIHEAKAMIEAVRKHERVFQTGSQQRSEGPFRDVADSIRNGRLGKIKEVHVALGGHSSKPCDLPGETEPKGLLWDVWLGQAPERPYNHVLCSDKLPNDYPFNPGWRDYSEFSGGYITDWGAHHFDITQWALGMDGSGPVEILPPEKEDQQYGAKLIYRGTPVGDEVVVTHVEKIELPGAAAGAAPGPRPAAASRRPRTTASCSSARRGRSSSTAARPSPSPAASRSRPTRPGTTRRSFSSRPATTRTGSTASAPATSRSATWRSGRAA